MPRIARIVAVGFPHHITQRGNYRQRIFYCDTDRLKYLSLIGEYSGKYGMTVLAYCLMDNHVHFIGIPHKEDSLSRTFNMAHMRYSQYINRRKKNTGHLWQGRFFSSVLDQNHLLSGVRYVERNPVRAKLVKRSWEWRWSSASSHTGKSKADLILGDLFGMIGFSQEKWIQFLSDEESGAFLNDFRKNTASGRPFGRTAFLKELESKYDRKLIALPRGRPKILKKIQKDSV